jgi:glycosyltransferase involved in cell wall biosynthesis
MTKLSVLLPIRPVSPGLADVIISIVNQTYSDWHIVALLDRDDGRNLRLLEELLEKDSFSVVACDYTTMGFPSMLNLGLTVATGQFIVRVDDDDVSTRDRFASQINYLLVNDNVTLVCGFAEVINNAGDTLYWIKQPENTFDLGVQLMRKNIIPHSSVMFRREPILALGGYSESAHGCEDYELWLRIATNGLIGSVNHKVVTYLNNPEGMSKTSIKWGVFRELRRVRMVAQKRMNLGFINSNFNDLVWVARQYLSRYR